jgi:hypothetical protein
MQAKSHFRQLSAVAVAVLAAFALTLCASAPTAEAAPAPRLGLAVVADKGGKIKGAAYRCAVRARAAARKMDGASKQRRAQRQRAVRSNCLTRMRAPRQSPAPRPGSRPATTLTIGIDGGHDEWWDDTINARAELGATVTRHEWDPPSEAVGAKDDLVYTAATEVHTRFHALLGGNDLGDAGHYRDWVVAFVGRYGPGGAFWKENPELDAGRYAITSIELGNEPYFGEMTPVEYAATVRPTLEALAAMGSPVKVILPSYIHGSRTTWMDTLYAQIPDLNSFFYAFADHPYWYGHNPAEGGDSGPFARLETLRARMDHHGAADKPIYITEYGESTADCGSECVSEATQAEHLKAMIDAVATRSHWQVELLSLFQLHDWASENTDREQEFGLLRLDETPKPSYPIVASAIEQYGA